MKSANENDEDDEPTPTWEDEASAVVADVRNHVRTIGVSEKLHSSGRRIYFNLVTLEGDEYCVEMSASGFAVVGKKFDSVEISAEDFHETPYSLLASLSAEYGESFGNRLIDRLQKLKDDS